MWWNDFKRLSFGKSMKIFFFFVVGAMLLYSLYWGFYRLLSYLVTVPYIGQLLIIKLVSMVFFMDVCYGHHIQSDCRVLDYLFFFGPVPLDVFPQINEKYFFMEGMGNKHIFLLDDFSYLYAVPFCLRNC